MLNQLLAALSQTSAFTEADTALCRQYFEFQTLKKGAVVEAAQQVPAHLYFVADGYMRLFYVDEQGDEVTTHLAGANEFLTPVLGFIHQQPATEALASITICKVLRITRPNLAALIEASEVFKKLSLGIFEKALAATEQRADSLATRSAAQRYHHLLAARPDVLLRVPVQHIASYLGMKSESLSRIRRQVSS
jgi:CRP-like cAMP-binding protein